LKRQIEYLQSIELPKQKSKEWYEIRHNLISASNLYKVFGSDAVVNSLIYEKCKPLEIGGDDYRSFSTTSPMHWGNKYEPVTIMIYEDMFETKIGDFGCIPHPEYPFIGASPDGINIDPENSRFGRMLEIKNIVNRDITGIPKEEYWVQTQAQMEVCNLDECDFVETKFIEYDGFQQYVEDDTNDKGVIAVFVKDNKFIYEYMPFGSNIDEWTETIIKNTEGEWFKNIYWKLDVFSCVLVKRNKEWFQSAIGHLEDLWRIVCEERITGEYSKRAPKKKEKQPLPINIQVHFTQDNDIVRDP
jgi:hypothetical protein